jgi:hypothetical protein
MMISSEHRLLIDESLQKIAAHEQKRAACAGISTQESPALEVLRQSVIGQHLEHLAEIAEQGLTMGRVEAKAMLKEVYQLLFAGSFQEYPLIPASFDNTPLGTLLYQARSRILDLHDVINVTEAARKSGLSRTLLYLMAEVGVIHPLNMANRLMVDREELDRLIEDRRQKLTEDPNKKANDNF